MYVHKNVRFLLDLIGVLGTVVYTVFDFDFEVYFFQTFQE